MVTVRSREIAEGSKEPQLAITARPRECVYCRQMIVWMRTYLSGRSLPFCKDPVPRQLDDGNGWVPGQFPGPRGKTITALAPLPMHPADKRRRVQHVMHLHLCQGVFAKKAQVA